MERAKARVVYDNAEGVATKYETAKGLREGGCVAEVNGEGIVNQKKCAVMNLVVTAVSIFFADYESAQKKILVGFCQLFDCLVEVILLPAPFPPLFCTLDHL